MPPNAEAGSWVDVVWQAGFDDRDGGDGDIDVGASGGDAGSGGARAAPSSCPGSSPHAACAEETKCRASLRIFPARAKRKVLLVSQR